MSLLLDALKKAAQEKQSADSADSTVEADAELDLLPVANLTQAPVDDDEKEPLVLEEFELDDYEYEVPDSRRDVEPADEITIQDIERQRITPTPSTVTDDALQLLIRKTNDEHKKSRFMVWGGVVAAAMVLLSISGFYFYTNMMHDIDSMHRKHQIALATLKSKTKIEENLTSLAIMPKTDAGKKNDSDTAADSPKFAGISRNAASAPAVNKQDERAFTVQRADKRDPVSEALQRGWQAYQNKEYETSVREYKKVLKTEPENHDALLGVAAVSLQQGEIETARDIYIQLLEYDPRDPHAHAGLANIAQTNGASLSETKLKQLIELRPEDSHLQFALGNLYVQKQSWPEAQQAFFNAWKADSKNPDYAYNLAVSLDQLGKHKEAKSFYENSLRLASGKNISFSPDAVKNRLAHLGAIDQQ